MAQSLSFGVYRIELAAGKATVLDQVGQLVVTVDLKIDAAAKIPLPAGHVLDVARLIDALGSGVFSELSSVAAAVNQAPVTIGSGMFFNSGFGLDAFGDRDEGQLMGNYASLGKLLGGLGEIGTLSGLSELQVLQPTEESAAPAPPAIHEGPGDLLIHHIQPTQQPSSGIAIDPHAPIALDESLTGFEDNSISRSVTASDPDGDPVTYSLLHGPRHGSLAFNADGTFTYAPVARYHGADSFTYQANDGSHDSNPGTVTLTITPANQAP